MNTLFLKFLGVIGKVLLWVVVLIVYYLVNSFGTKLDNLFYLEGYSVEYFSEFQQSDLLIGIAGVVVTIVSVSIPIALSAISDHLKDYNEKVVYDYFLSEFTFKFQVHHFAFLITLLTAIILFKVKSITMLAIVSVIFIWSLFEFKKFILIIVEYLTNTDEVILRKIRSDIEGYLS